MPNYNKKSFSKKRIKPKKQHPIRTTEINDFEEDIFMSDDTEQKPTKKQTPKKELKVLKGRKKLNELRLKIISGVFTVVLVICICFVLLSPVSAFETIGNISASIGTGSFPVDEIGNETIEVFQHNNVFFVLTDTAVESYNISGKKIFSDLHGIGTPVMVNSPSRVLLYEPGGNTVNLYSTAGKKLSITTDSTIYCAAISKSGNFAVATKCDGYTSKFTLYNKKGDVVFSWCSPDMLINAITLSQNGKRAAVSMLCADNGNILSKVCVFDFSSSTPLTTFEFSGKTVYNLYCNSFSGFGILLNDSYKFVKWNKFTVTENSLEYDAALSRTDNSKTAVCSSVGSDRANNYFTVFSSRNKKIASFSLQKPVDDFVIKGNKILVLSNTEILLLDFEGNTICTTECDFGVVRLVYASSKSALTLFDNRIGKINF